MKHFKEMSANSDREYTNILVSYSDSLMAEIFEIFSHPHRIWKSVQFFSTDFESSDELKELFSCFESTARNLTLHHVSIKSNATLSFKNFKNLQKLKIYFTDSIIYKGILQSASNLKFLELGTVQCILQSSIAAVKNLEHLKTLHMSKDWAIKFFETEVSDIKFKLKEFDMMLPHENSKDEINSENFMEFIETQTELESLELIEWLSFKVLNKIFQSKITQLSLRDVPEGGWDTNFVPINKSIETLDLKFVYIDPHYNNIREFLSRLPNVKNLKLRSINEEIAAFIGANMPNIQKISTIHGDDIDEDIRQILPKVVYN